MPDFPNRMWSLIQSIGSIGQLATADLQEAKLRRFLNIMNVVGVFIAGIHAIIVYPFSPTASILHLAWGAVCLLSLWIHHRFGFGASKFITFTSILLFGHLASALIGPESLPQIASLGVVVAIFMMYSIEKSWRILLYYTLLEIAGIVLVESRLLQEVIVPENYADFQRKIAIIGTLLFVIFEFVFFVNLTLANERVVIDRLKKLNRENELLLKEVHHRVKNNLQLVSSLLRMQESAIDDPKVDLHFKDAYTRINSISLLHQKVYQGEQLGQIDFKEYLLSVADAILQTYSPEKVITFDIVSSIEKIDNDSLFPIALIFNELITNSIKHGLKDATRGAIHIHIRNVEGDLYSFSYRDSGTWIPPKHTSSIGLELIESLAEQMNGTFKLQIEQEHAHFIVTFQFSERFK